VKESVMKTHRPAPDPDPRPGTGALCPEAQADGVPCTEKGRDCETCERAAGTEHPAKPEHHPRGRLGRLKP
jgi:hypothetical protein